MRTVDGQSFRLVFLTRTERPSGARVAAELARQGWPLVAIVAERRVEMVRRRRGVLRAGWDAVRQHGVGFVVGRAGETVRAKARRALRMRAGENFACVSEVAERFGVPLHIVNDHNGAGCVDLLRSLQPDLIAVTNARVLNGAVLGVARRGCLNLHTSKLPQYRGLESIFWALYHGETEIGVTVHFLEEALDAGDIVLQQTFPVGANDTVETLYAQTIEAGARLMAEAVRQVAAGTAQRVPQSGVEATAFGWPTPQQRRELAWRLRQRRRMGVWAYGRMGEAPATLTRPYAHTPTPAVRKVRVAHIITRLIQGGAQENTLLTVRHLNSDRYDTVLISGPALGDEGELFSKAQAQGVHLTLVPHLIREVHPWHDLRAFIHLYRLLRQGNYDIVHTHSSKAGILGRIAAKCAGVPVIVHSPHSHIFYGYFGKAKTLFFLWMERAVARMTDRIFCLTPIEKDDHIAYKVGTPDMFVVAPSGVPLERFYSVDRACRGRVRAEWGIQNGALVIVCVARLAPVKGHKSLLDTMVRVQREVPNAVLLLVGDGPLREALKTQAAQTGISDRVVFAGVRDDVPELLAASDLFALASLNEGMGRVIVEAMAAGLPVVATAVGGVPAVVEDGGSGLLVPSQDSEKLADALITLLRDESLRCRMGDAGRQRAEAFSVDAMMQAIEGTYEELLSQRCKFRS